MQERDLTDAYENGRYIDGAAEYPPRWEAASRAFRDRHPDALLDLAYGPKPRNRLDLFLPAGRAQGLLVFIHGGYWMKFAPSTWSHLAAGPVAAGWAVAMPGYTLAPEARIGEIGQEIAAAIAEAAARVAGPVRLAGHSAGGHLAARMACSDTPLDAAARARLDGVVSISGLHDLAPLMRTGMNRTLRLDAAEVAAESPVHHRPLAGVDVIAWVGADERPEFLRQTELLAAAWPGCRAHVIPGRHHFDIIDGLTKPDSPLCLAALTGAP